MKKVLFVVMFICFVSTINAQLVRGYGLKAGATFASQDWDYSEIGNLDVNKRTGLNVGLFAELLDMPLFSVVTELNYVQKGMKDEMPRTTVINPDGDGSTITWDTKLDYINISALAKLRTDFGIFTPYIIGGPKMDFEVNKAFSVDIIDEVKDNFKKNRFGMKVGFGTEVHLSSLGLLVAFMYDADFNELYENQNMKINTSSMDLRVGIYF